MLVDEPFAGLTARETEAFAKLIRELRDDGRAVLIVDHNVKSVAALVDRVLAMYVGERIAAGSVDEVMRDETVRRVYLGGALTTAARPESTFRDAETPFLAVNNVNVHYGKAQALDNVSLHVHKGEFVAVVGLNGAGKTTLFKAISGLVPYAGEISARRRNRCKGLSAAKIARAGIVQSPEGRELFSDMSVAENLEIGGARLDKAERRRRLDWLHDLFPSLKERARQNAGTLSGGEQQMLTIARALMMRPDLLILDEPTLGLAPVILEQISKALDQAQPDDADHRAARRAERHLRPAPRRPRLRPRARPHCLGGRSEPLRERSGREVSVKSRASLIRPLRGALLPHAGEGLRRRAGGQLSKSALSAATKASGWSTVT